MKSFPDGDRQMDTEVSKALQAASGVPECRETGDRKTPIHTESKKDGERGGRGEIGRGRQRRKKLRAGDRDRERVGGRKTHTGVESE